MPHNDDLEPCPFCGSTKLSAPPRVYTNAAHSHYVLMVRCRACGAQGPHVDVQQVRDDGQPYAHTSRRPKMNPGFERWQRIEREAAMKARELWNRRAP